MKGVLQRQLTGQGLKLIVHILFVILLLTYTLACSHTQVLWPRNAAFSDLRTVIVVRVHLKNCCMCANTHIHKLGFPWDDETAWNRSFFGLMILQSSSSDPMGPYGLGVHFETRFTNTLSALGKEHIIYYLQHWLDLSFFFLFHTFKAWTDTETHSQQNNTKRYSSCFKYFPKLFCPTIPYTINSASLNGIT